jgi:hypothetical protein
MIKYYEELDWPEVPSEFCITDENYMISNFAHCHPVQEYLFYRQYNNYNSTLHEILQPLFQFDIKGRIFYQIVKKGISIHKDIGRKIIYNYILDQGGDNVYTKFYNEDKVTEEFSICIPANRWHTLDTSYYHNVIGIERPRIAISIYEKFTNT